MRVYKEIDKPSNLMEVEGRCPLCSTVMDKSKSISYGGNFYSFDFPIYLCIAHYHGYFRWLGRKGNVRILLPEILSRGKVVGQSPKGNAYAEAGLMSIVCPDCGFEWEEVEIPHSETYCPDCGMKIDLSTRFGEI